MNGLSMWQLVCQVLFDPVCLVCHIRLNQQRCHLCECCEALLQKSGRSNVISVVDWQRDSHALGLTEFLGHGQFRTGFVYEGIMRDLLHQFKYKQQFNAGRCLALKLAECLQSMAWEQYQGVIPMPVHARRLRQRRLHVTDYLIRRAISQCGIDVLVLPTYGWRISYDPPQMSLSKSERKAMSTHHRFNIPMMLSGHWLVFDDVVTTGYSLRSLLKALRCAGAEQLSVLCLAQVL